MWACRKVRRVDQRALESTSVVAGAVLGKTVEVLPKAKPLGKAVFNVFNYSCEDPGEMHRINTVSILKDRGVQ